RLLVKTVLAVAKGSIGNVFFVRRPHRIEVSLSGRSAKSEGSLHAALAMEAPNVKPSSIEIVGELFSVRRQTDTGVSVFSRHRSSLLAIAVKPNQLAILGDAFGVEKQTVFGGRKPSVCNAGILADLFRDRDGFARKLEVVCVERLGHQRGLEQEEKMSRCIRG